MSVEEEKCHPPRKILQLSHQTTGIQLKTLRTIMSYLVDVVCGALPVEGENFFESDFFIEEDVEMEALFKPNERDESLHCRLGHILLQS